MIESSFKSIKTKLYKNTGWCLILVSTFLLKIFLIFLNCNSLTFLRRICHNSGIVRGSWHGCAAPSKFPPLFFFYRRHPSLLSLVRVLYPYGTVPVQFNWTVLLRLLVLAVISVSVWVLDWTADSVLLMVSVYLNRNDDRISCTGPTSRLRFICIDR